MENWQLISLVLFVALVSSLAMARILSGLMINVTNNLTATAAASADADAHGGKSGTPIMAWVFIGLIAFMVVGGLMAEQARQITSAEQPSFVPESAPVEAPAVAATEVAPVVPAATALPEVAPIAVPEAVPVTAPEWLPVVLALAGLNVVMLVLARAAVAHARKKLRPRSWEIEPEKPVAVDYLEQVLDRDQDREKA